MLAASYRKIDLFRIFLSHGADFVHNRDKVRVVLNRLLRRKGMWVERWNALVKPFMMYLFKEVNGNLLQTAYPVSGIFSLNLTSLILFPL